MSSDQNLAVLGEASMSRKRNERAMQFEGEFVTHGTLLTQAKRLQRGLAKLGLARGNVAAMCMTNHPHVYATFAGIFRTGGTAVPVLSQLAVGELRYIFEHTEAIGIVTDVEVIEKVREAVDDLPHLQWLAVRGGETDSSRTIPEYALEELLQEEEQDELPEISGEDIALMLYTSGTTGRPKGVMLTHDSMVISAYSSRDASEYHLRPHPMIGLTSLPMAHIFGVGVMKGQYVFPEELESGYIIQEKWFEPGRFLEIIQRERVTDLYVVPTMLSLMLAHPQIDKFDLTSLEIVYVGAAPLPLEVANEMIERSGCFIKQLYGMTENSGQGTAGRMSRGYCSGSAGVPYDTTDLQIVDDNDNPVPQGSTGEIVTRGPTTMKGYFKAEEATAEVMRGGWLHTGDIGYMDESGHLFVVDRKKDMIIKGGENIFPAEVENALYTHADVAEAAVVGVPDAIYGEEIVAFVARQEGSEIGAQELINHVKTQVVSLKAPAAVYFLDKLPKSGVGKILRRELRDQAAEAYQAAK